jgi:predicted aldo/keto reductase-like oxidoreductase
MSNKLSNYKQINGKDEIKKTPARWCAELNIRILDYKGVFTVESYADKHYKLEEFLNLVSNCELEKPTNQSRRDASFLKQKLNKKLNY